MRRFFLAGEDVAALVGFPLGLALHQHVDPAPERGDLGLLARNDLGQVIGDPFKMGEFFFELFHGLLVAVLRRAVKCALAAPCPGSVHPVEAGRDP